MFNYFTVFYAAVILNFIFGRPAICSQVVNFAKPLLRDAHVFPFLTNKIILQIKMNVSVSGEIGEQKGLGRPSVSNRRWEFIAI